MKLIEKLQYRLQGWQGKLLSRGGRLQLLNSVMSSIPIYFMSCFKLPDWVIKKIDKLRRDFLWGKSDNTRGMSLLNWDSCRLAKSSGGLGISDIEFQNLSLLLHWWWRLYQSKEELWAITALQLRVKRIPINGGTKIKIWNKSGSFFWNLLIKIRPFFLRCTSWVVGDGTSISFWYDAWDGPPLIEYSENFIPPQPMLSLRDAVPILSDIAPQVTLNFDSHRDAICWDLIESGTYSSRSLYRILRDGGKIGWAFSYVWKVKAPPTVRIFGSLAIQNKILTREVLQIRNIPCQLNCPMCNSGNPETICHLLFTCAYAREVWGFVQNTAMKLILTRQLDRCSSIEEVWKKSWLEARGQGGMAKAE